MFSKITALPVDQGKEWWTVVHMERNDVGEVRIEWNPEVFADPNGVLSVLRMLEQSAEEAQAELTSAANEA